MRLNTEKKKALEKIDVIEKSTDLGAKKPSAFPMIPNIRSTADLLGHGVHYFIESEERLAKDFFFEWLPSKIRKYLKLIIPFMVMFFVLTINLDVSPEIKSSLALFLCIALLWAMESINIVVTALLIPVLAVALGLVKNSNPFISFSNPIIYLLLSGLIIAQTFRKHSLDKMIALKVLALSNGRIKLLLLYTMLITAFFGMWMSNTATIALLVPVIITISGEISSSTKKNYTSMLLLAAGFSSSIGGLATILGGNPNAISAAFLRDRYPFSFFDWSRVGIPVSVFLFITAYIVFLKLYSLGDEKIKISKIKKESLKFTFNREQKKIILIFLPTVFFWLLGGKISTYLHLPLDFYRTEVIGLVAAILLFALRVLNWEDVRRIPWEIFLLVGGGLTLGQILINTGTADFLALSLFPVISPLPTFMIILFIVFLSIALANFVNNSSTTIILTPVLLSLSAMIGINSSLLVMSAAMATAVSSLTPISMPSFSIIYGTGEVRREEMIRTGTYIAVSCGIVLSVVIYIFYRFF